MIRRGRVCSGRLAHARADFQRQFRAAKAAAMSDVNAVLQLCNVEVFNVPTTGSECSSWFLRARARVP